MGKTPNNTSPNRQPTFTTTVTMGRLHSNGKGISASAIPYSRTPPSWLKTTPEQVVDQICKLAKKGATPSQIGVVLRDSHGIAQVKVVTGNKILRILKSNGLAPEIPEDLYMLSRRPSPSASISSATARIRTPSSVSFSSSPVFTVSPVTTRLSVFCHQPGDPRAPPPAPWSHRCGKWWGF